MLEHFLLARCLNLLSIPKSLKRSPIRSLIALCALGLPWTYVHAEWLKATSANFVVYTDDSEKDVRRFSEQLERYHAAMVTLEDPDRAQFEPSPSNRVTVYVVRSDREVRRLYGEGNRYVTGFYVPRAGRSLAIVPEINAKNGVAQWSMIVLLHEYAHHFMSTSDIPFPDWMSEGAAEFYSQASFDQDGTVWLGRAANHRVVELLLARDVKAEELLDPDVYKKNKSESHDAFYGKSWLLYHYLTFSEERAGQFAKYLQLLGKGSFAREAALESFGDFAKLDEDLEAYLSSLKKRQIKSFKLPPSKLKIGSVTVSALSEGEEAIMPIRIFLRRGVNKDTAKKLVIEARAMATRYPNDPEVLSNLAEAEYYSGHLAEAIIAADAAIALDTKQVSAYVYKGVALFEKAKEASDTAAAYKLARVPFVALNKIENDHPIPLIYYYRSFIEQGMQPSELAMSGFERALQLAPFDLNVRMGVAQMQIANAQTQQARRTLLRLAYNPHAGELAEVARKMLENLNRADGVSDAGPSAISIDERGTQEIKAH